MFLWYLWHVALWSKIGLKSANEATLIQAKRAWTLMRIISRLEIEWKMTHDWGRVERWRRSCFAAVVVGCDEEIVVVVRTGRLSGRACRSACCCERQSSWTPGTVKWRAGGGVAVAESPGHSGRHFPTCQCTCDPPVCCPTTNSLPGVVDLFSSAETLNRKWNPSVDNHRRMRPKSSDIEQWDWNPNPLSRWLLCRVSACPFVRMGRKWMGTRQQQQTNERGKRAAINARIDKRVGTECPRNSPPVTMQLSESWAPSS